MNIEVDNNGIRISGGSSLDTCIGDCQTGNIMRRIMNMDASLRAMEALYGINPPRSSVDSATITWLCNCPTGALIEINDNPNSGRSTINIHIGGCIQEVIRREMMKLEARINVVLALRGINPLRSSVDSAINWLCSTSFIAGAASVATALGGYFGFRIPQLHANSI